MSGVNIGPLEAFQGLESRLVILCTTRTRNRFIAQDIATGLGVIHESKRFNVALTRAKEGLIVIGNRDVLGQEDNWKAFLAFCDRSGVSEGVKYGSSNYGDEAVISRLESQLLIREKENDNNELDGAHSLAYGIRRLGYIEDTEDALWRSGVAAEHLLVDRDQPSSEYS